MNKARLWVGLFIAVVVLGPPSPVRADEKALTNADIVTLAKAGFGDALLIDKIDASPRIDFDLSTDGLVKLKQQGISQNVIGEMLKRGKAASGGGNPPGSAKGLGAASGAGTWTVRLVSKEGGTLDLVKMNGSISYSGMGLRTFHEFVGATSKMRTKDRQPTLLIATTASPQGQYFVVKTDSSTKKQKRSVKIGAGMLGMHGATSPDEDWTVAYDCNQTAAGIWQLQLSRSLEPGEYGLYVSSQNQLTAGDLFDFGVDP